MTDLASIERKLDDLQSQLLRAHPPIFMTTDEVADFLKVSRERVFQWRKEGIGPKWCGPTSRTVRYHLDDIVAWMKA